MNGTRTITMLAVVCSLFLVLSAHPATAVSFIDQFFAEQNNAEGSDTEPMTDRDTTFCYLSSVDLEDTDTVAERAGCRVIRGARVWVLEAFLTQNDDADARCSAICYNN